VVAVDPVASVPVRCIQVAASSKQYLAGEGMVPTHNTTLCAGICMYMLVGDNEPGAQVFSAANDKNQAAYIYREMASMVRQSGELSAVLDTVDTQKIIHLTEWDPSRQCSVRNGAYYQALSADVATKEGLNISALIVDELHALADRTYWSTLAYGGASRRQPLVPFSISTAGIYDPASIGWEQYQFARGVRDGAIEDWSFFSLIYEADEKDDWTKESTWKSCNPSYGFTVKPDAFREECLEAQESPAKQNDLLRYRLNRWVQQNTRAIDLRVWDENRGHDALVDDERAWYGGLDLGGSADLSAWVMVGQCPDDPESVDVRCRFWLPEETLNGKHPNAGLYRQWARSGHLVTTPGNITDERFIQKQIESDAQTFHFVDGNIDRLFQGMQLTNALQEEGIVMLPFGQGFFSMAAPTKRFLDLVAARRLHHCGHPILRWMADNVVLRKDPAGNCKVDKEKSAQKVDGIVACVMALDRFDRRVVDEEFAASRDFEERGLFL
jgi:phage terminase large subunit-like protein